MDERDTAATIPYFAHEGEMTRMERINRRLWILVLVFALALIGTNAGWVFYESQFKDKEFTVEVQQDTDGSGNNTFTGNTVQLTGGDLNGQTNDQNNNPAASEKTD